MPFALSADQLLQLALPVDAGDVMVLAAALVPHGVPIGCEQVGPPVWDGRPIDHAVSFHAPVRSTIGCCRNRTPQWAVVGAR